MKLKAKLLLGFLTVSLICAAVGTLGYMGTKEGDTALHELGEVVIPSILYLEIAKMEQINLRVAARTLMNPFLDDKIVDTQFDNIKAARKSYTEAIKGYDPIPRVPEEDRLYKEFQVKLSESKIHNDEFFKEAENHKKTGVDKLELARKLYTMNMQGAMRNAFFDSMKALQELIDFVKQHYVHDEVAKLVAASANSMRLILIISILSFFIAVGIGYTLAQKIAKPIQQVTFLANEISDGVFSHDKLHLKTKDEIGIMATSFNKMMDVLQTIEKNMVTIAAGDLTVEVKRASDRDSLGQAMISMVENLNDLLGQINDAVGQVSSGSNQVSKASQELSQGASEQAASLEEITASITELTSQTKQNTDNSIQMNALSKQTKDLASVGNKKMSELVEAFTKINASSDEIKKIVKTIDDIAFQINLLALNANVEAARAGKYGKGFAVVAEEVRNLAVRSAAAAKETAAKVDENMTNMGIGNKLVEETAKQLVDITESNTKVTDISSEVATASREQLNAFGQVESGVNQVNQVVQENTASAEESASASEELAAQAEQLQSMIARFKLKNRRPQTFNSAVQEKKRTEVKKAPTQTLGKTQTKKRSMDEDGVTLVRPTDVIKLDDDDFSEF